jgi:hypothetical protein
MLSSPLTLPAEVDLASTVNLPAIQTAFNAARASCNSADPEDLADLILAAANAMPDTAGDFDRGIAVGLALARMLPDLVA